MSKKTPTLQGMTLNQLFRNAGSAAGCVCFCPSRRKTNDAVALEVKQRTTYCRRDDWKQTAVRGFVRSQERDGKEDIFLILTCLVAWMNMKDDKGKPANYCSCLSCTIFFTFFLSLHSAGPTRLNNLLTLKKKKQWFEDYCSPLHTVSLLMPLHLSLPSVFLRSLLYLFSLLPQCSFDFSISCNLKVSKSDIVVFDQLTSDTSQAA